jgi:hypothetical protein
MARPMRFMLSLPNKTGIGICNEKPDATSQAEGGGLYGQTQMFDRRL